MLGMYPPDGSFTEVVELHTKDTTYDYITANSKFVHVHTDACKHRSTHVSDCAALDCVQSLASMRRCSRTALCGKITKM